MLNLYRAAWRRGKNAGRRASRAMEMRPVEMLEGRTLLTLNFSGFSLPLTINPTANGITVGPDGNLWVGESNTGKVARITPAGAITEYPLPGGQGVTVNEITAGPGGLWFIESGKNGQPKVGEITTAGVVTEFDLPTPDIHPGRIVEGSDGNLWFTETYRDKIGRITPAGDVTEFPLPTTAATLTNPTPIAPSTVDITPGPDGNLWFTEQGTDVVGRITTAGVVTEFHVGGSNPSSVALASITSGPDGNVWFTLENYPASLRVGRITPAGVSTLFTSKSDGFFNIGGGGITTGPDGNLWFAKQGTDVVGRITTAGVISEFHVGGSNLSSAFLGSITSGPDGNLWFTSASSIIRMSTAGAVATFALPVTISTDPTLGSGSGVNNLVIGTDGSFYFSDQSSQKINRSSADGVVQAYSLPDGMYVGLLAAAPGGGVLFTASDPRGRTELGRLTADGRVSIVSNLGFAGADSISGLAVTPGGVIWLADTTQGGASQLVRVTQAGAVTIVPVQESKKNGFSFSGVRSFGFNTPVVAAPGGGVYYSGLRTLTERGGSAEVGVIGRVYPSGKVTETWVGAPVPQPAAGDTTTPSMTPFTSGEMVATPDGSLIIAETGSVGSSEGTSRLARLTPEGGLLNIPLPVFRTAFPDLVSSLIVGPDGNVWYTLSDSNFDTGPNPQPRIGRVTSSGIVTTFPLPEGVVASVFATGPGGNLWFTDRNAAFTHFKLPAGPTGTLTQQTDHGPLSQDGVTNDSTPVFSGVASPGALVRVYAERSDAAGAKAKLVAKGVANRGGVWTAPVLQPLRDGAYTITVSQTIHGQAPTPALPLEPFNALGTGRLVIDTKAPRITAVTYDDSLGSIDITYQDRGAGMNIQDFSNLTEAATYSVTPAGGSKPIASNPDPLVNTLDPNNPPAPTDPLTVLDFLTAPQKGKPLTLRVFAHKATDLAGNALDGAFHGKFPSGNGHLPRRDFVITLSPSTHVAATSTRHRKWS